MKATKLRLNQLLGLYVQDGEFVRHTPKDRREYFNLIQLQKEIDKLEARHSAGKISAKRVDAKVKVIQDKLNALDPD